MGDTRVILDPQGFAAALEQALRERFGPGVADGEAASPHPSYDVLDLVEQFIRDHTHGFQVVDVPQQGMVIFHTDEIFSADEMKKLRRALWDDAGKRVIVAVVPTATTVEAAAASEVARLGLTPLLKTG